MHEIKIFLASSSELKADRDEFEKFIRRTNSEWRNWGVRCQLEIWEDTSSAMSAEGSQSEYNKILRDCDLFVLLAQNKVGKYTNEEFDNAYEQFIETGNPLIFTYFKPPSVIDAKGFASVAIFLEKLSELGHFKTDYETSSDLINHFGAQLSKQYKSLISQQPDQGVANNRVPLQMPPLPRHFVERPKHQDAVRECLLRKDGQGSGTLVVSAIYGLGGIGKSVLASKLAHDKVVQARFSDGILWTTLGQGPDILPLLSGWIQALGDYDYKPTAIESASNHLRTLLYDKRVLLVVDDVWDPSHLEPFRVGNDESCVLVTTREAKITDANRYDLDVMDERQSIELINQKLSSNLADTALDQAAVFAKRVGYLPLALELAASQIEQYSGQNYETRTPCSQRLW